jgi:ABC-type uncharacterized transport system substrate-binding protein
MRPILLALGAFLFPAAAEAHPHVFAEARLDVVVNSDGTVKSLRHLWRFDDLFSSTVLMEFDKNADLKLDDAELAEVSNTVHSSLAEYNYFQLVILFESEPNAPFALRGKVDFGIYDPTFYTAIDFTEDDHMAVSALPAFCKRQVIRPDPDEALAQNQASLTPEFFNDPTGTNLSKIFATKLELDCGAQG